MNEKAKYTFNEALVELDSIHGENSQLILEHSAKELSDNDFYAKFGANLNRMKQVWLKVDWGTL